MTTEIKAYEPVKAVLADLSTRYVGLVFAVTTPTGMAEAKSAYKDINQYNIALEDARKKEKADSLAYGRLVDSEAKRISDQLDLIRLPIKDQIETETKREQREKEEAMRLAAEKFNAEQAAIKAAEEKRMADEREALAKERAELEEQQRASRLKIEEEERQARMIREEADREARIVREAEEAKLKAKRDQIEAEARAIAAEKRKALEMAEAIERVKREAAAESARQFKQELLALSDARGVLIMFRDTYGARPEFAGVVASIEAYFERNGK